MDGFQIVANVLFVERRLRAARLVGSARPEARGIRSEHLVGQDELVAQEAEFEFCVGDDDAASFGVACRALVDR